MKKQDIARPRNFEDILYRIAQMKKNIKTDFETLTRINNELNNFIISTTQKVLDLQNQIDGNITTWFNDAVPTLNNYPATEWEEKEYALHLGDLYYDTSTGYSYRFALQGEMYLWIKLTDSDVTEALALASMAQDTADGKRRVFTETPAPPYDIGDLYFKNQELYICNTEKQQGNYEENDFIIATKYTDDAKANEVLKSLNNFVDVTYKNAMSNLTNQIDGKISTWYYEGIPTLSNSPACDWSDEEKLSHLGDLYYDKQTGYTYIFEQLNDSYTWTKISDNDVTEALALANAAQDTADSKRRIFVNQPVPPYDNGDLWIKDSEIYICQISKIKEQQFQEQDFINNLKYTDNTVANAIVDELGGTTTTVLQGQVVLISKNFAKFTDLKDPNSSTTIAGENITTGNIKSQNYVENKSGTKIGLEDGTIDTKNFKLDENGNVNLENGATVISEKGLMNTYTYDTKGFQIVGFMGDDIFAPSKANKESATINLIIPENFNITKAIVHLFHTPVNWYTDTSMVWGYCRNLKLYKANNMYSRKIYGEYFGGYYENDDTLYDEISGAFGTNGYTASIATDGSHVTEKAISGDISQALKDSSGNTISGLHQLKIESGFNFTEELTQNNIVAKTGSVFAILRIDGFMKYEKEEV